MNTISGDVVFGPNKWKAIIALLFGKEYFAIIDSTTYISSLVVEGNKKKFVMKAHPELEVIIVDENQLST